jgi:hypothetical protein
LAHDASNQNISEILQPVENTILLMVICLFHKNERLERWNAGGRGEVKHFKL